MKHLDYEKHCFVPQFSYVQTLDDPSAQKTQVAHTFLRHYLHAARIQQDGNCLKKFGHK